MIAANGDSSKYESIWNRSIHSRPAVSSIFEDFDRILSSMQVSPNPQYEPVQSTGPCTVHSPNARSWILGALRAAGRESPFGRVPVSIHEFDVSSDCKSYSTRAIVASAEFVVHRFGDPVGLHYAIEFSPQPPFDLYAFEKIGVVPEDALGEVTPNNSRDLLDGLK